MENDTTGYFSEADQAWMEANPEEARAIVQGPPGECEPCRLAAGIGIADNICQTFKGELDCQVLEQMLKDPENHTLADAQKAIEQLAEKSEGKPRELLDRVVCIMNGQCPIPADSEPDPQ